MSASSLKDARGRWPKQKSRKAIFSERLIPPGVAELASAQAGAATPLRFPVTIHITFPVSLFTATRFSATLIRTSPAVRQTTPSRVFIPSHGSSGLSPAERAVYDSLDPTRIPQHVAIIMDGNGRWAGKRALKRFLGHQQGAESVRYVVETAARIDLPWLTLYAFSLENKLRRPKSEVSFLMKLLKTYLVSNMDSMKANNIRVAYIGRTQELPSEVQDTM